MKRSVRMKRAAVRRIVGAAVATWRNTLLIMNTQSADRENTAAILAHLLVVRDGGAGGPSRTSSLHGRRETRPAHTTRRNVASVV
jgi:hypothetical protein